MIAFEILLSGLADLAAKHPHARFRPIIHSFDELHVMLWPAAWHDPIILRGDTAAILIEIDRLLSSIMVPI